MGGRGGAGAGAGRRFWLGCRGPAPGRRRWSCRCMHACAWDAAHEVWLWPLSVGRRHWELLLANCLIADAAASAALRPFSTPALVRQPPYCHIPPPHPLRPWCNAPGTLLAGGAHPQAGAQRPEAEHCQPGSGAAADGYLLRRGPRRRRRSEQQRRQRLRVEHAGQSGGHRLLAEGSAWVRCTLAPVLAPRHDRCSGLGAGGVTGGGGGGVKPQLLGRVDMYCTKS